jgi:hypothetical protein
MSSQDLPFPPPDRPIDDDPMARIKIKHLPLLSEAAGFFRFKDSGELLRTKNVHEVSVLERKPQTRCGQGG